MSSAIRTIETVNRDFYFTEEDRDEALANIYETANVIEYLKNSALVYS